MMKLHYNHHAKNVKKHSEMNMREIEINWEGHIKKYQTSFFWRFHTFV